MRVLLVDDDVRFISALEALLSTLEGIDVCGRATDGTKAIEAAARLNPDVVVMDFDMPVLDGIEATKAIRARRPETAVVILSGSDVIAHSAGAHAAGAVAYVRKANASDDLPHVLAALLKRGSG